MSPLKRAPTPSTAFTVPPLTSDPAYAEADAALAAMKAHLRVAESERDAALYESSVRTHDARAARVAQLLGEATEEVEAPETRVTKMNAEISDVRAALEVLRERLTAARMAASRPIVEQARPEYVARANALAATVRAALEAHVHFEELRDQLIAADIAWVGPLPVVRASRFLGEVNDKDSAAHRFIREVAEMGPA
ncbi:hypothetical protein [Roseixanthobacter pseudopolyaromaticivorans]|uniref:hypothetical protein n=1 Tax=Xanthobacteraceae TaxID=335928 RepID=UPI00372753F2